MISCVLGPGAFVFTNVQKCYVVDHGGHVFNAVMGVCKSKLELFPRCTATHWQTRSQVCSVFRVCSDVADITGNR